MSQDIEIDPDSRTITYYEKPTVESIKEHLDAGGLAIGVGQARALLDEIDRLRKLVPPESERGPGFVGQGSWSVFAEKVVEERDAAREGMKQLLAEKIEFRDELSSLCEEIRILKEENDELREELEQLGDMVSAKKEHANIHLGGKGELHGIDGYGPFNLKQVDKDRWEIWMLHEKVTLYNKKGHRVRGDHNYEGDW
jgi:regulator of replication initiation timing